MGGKLNGVTDATPGFAVLVRDGDQVTIDYTVEEDGEAAELQHEDAHEQQRHEGAEDAMGEL